MPLKQFFKGSTVSFVTTAVIFAQNLAINPW